MIRQVLVVENNLGLHARAAAQLVRLASGFDCDIFIAREGSSQQTDSKSILGVLMLAAAKGSRLELTVSGPDETEAVEAIRNLFRNKFGEGA